MALDDIVQKLSLPELRDIVSSPEKRLHFSLQNHCDVAALWRASFTRLNGARRKRSFNDVVYDVLSVYQTLPGTQSFARFASHVQNELGRKENRTVRMPQNGVFEEQVAHAVRDYIHDSRLSHDSRDATQIVGVAFSSKDYALITRDDALPEPSERITSVSIPAAVHTPEGVFNTVLRNFQAGRFTGQTYTLQDIVLQVARGLGDNVIPFDAPCPITGFVAHQLYEHVRSKLPGAHKRITSNRRVGIVDVRQRLRLDLNRASKDHIVGVVSPDYLKEHYVFDNNILMYRDVEGKLHSHPLIEGTTCWDSDDKEIVRDAFTSFVVKQLGLARRKKDSTIQYLGLEGPSFGSFFPLVKACREKLGPLRGTFVEYDSRCYNIMQSIQRAGLTSLLDGTHTLFGDVDDHILLDFVKDTAVSLVRKEANGGPAGLYVRYEPPRKKTEHLELDKYHTLLEALDNGVSRTELCVDYGVSRNFIDAVSDRHEGRFDIVFLDYVGGLTTKRGHAFETLVKRRLSDDAIVAATINTAHRITPLRNHGPVARLSTAFFDRVIDCFNKAGYEGTEMLHLPYREGPKTDPMCFQAYYVERKKTN